MTLQPVASLAERQSHRRSGKRGVKWCNCKNRSGSRARPLTILYWRINKTLHPLCRHSEEYRAGDPNYAELAGGSGAGWSRSTNLLRSVRFMTGRYPMRAAFKSAWSVRGPSTGCLSEKNGLCRRHFEKRATRRRSVESGTWGTCSRSTCRRVADSNISTGITMARRLFHAYARQWFDWHRDDRATGTRVTART